jgi:hypothetical protein
MPPLLPLLLLLLLLSPGVGGMLLSPGVGGSSISLLGLTQPDYQRGPPALSAFDAGSGAVGRVLRTFTAIKGLALQNTLTLDTQSGTLCFAVLDAGGGGGTTIVAADASSGAVRGSAQLAGGVPHLGGVDRAGVLRGVNVVRGVASLLEAPVAALGNVSSTPLSPPVRGYLPEGLGTSCPTAARTTGNPYVFHNGSHLLSLDLGAPSAAARAAVAATPCAHDFASLQADCSSSGDGGGGGLVLYGVVQGTGAPQLVKVTGAGGAAACSIAVVASFAAAYDVATPTAMHAGAHVGVLVAEQTGVPVLAVTSVAAAQPSVTLSPPLGFAPLAFVPLPAAQQ